MTHHPSRRQAIGPGLLLSALLLVVIAAGSGCQGGRTQQATDRADAGPGNRDWYAGTPLMQKNIRSLIKQIPNTTGAARIELGRRIVASGEPAIPILLESLSSPHPETRGMAAWLLGFTSDPRTADALYQATGDCDSLVAYEAAASLVRMGDRRGICRTIVGLEDADPRVRAKCLDVLLQKTGETFGFLPDDAPHERAAAVARWKAWGARLPEGGL